MNDPKHDPLKEKGDELRRRLGYSPDPPEHDKSSVPPPPPPSHEKKAFSSFCCAITEVLAKSIDKTAAELTQAARADLSKKTFAVPAKKSNTGKPAYPIPDEQHARSALGFAKMHGDSADYAAVRAKVEKKYPNLMKKQAMLIAAEQVLLSKEAAGLLQRLGQGLASEAGTHKAELAGLGILAVPGVDALQAHGRAALAGDYNKAGVKKRTVLPHAAHPIAETAGLGVLAAPSLMHLRGH